MNSRLKIGLIAVLGAAVGLATFSISPYIADVIAIKPALAAGGTVEKPNTVAPDRYVYYPGTEVLGEDEIRLFACGTGMPSARRDQAATTVFGGNDINSTFLQPILNYTTPSAWTFGLNTESTYNWTTNEWSIPINATISKLVNLGGQRVSLQGVFAIMRRVQREERTVGEDDCL